MLIWCLGGSFVCIIVSKAIQKSTEIKHNTEIKVEIESDIEIENQTQEVETAIYQIAWIIRDPLGHSVLIWCLGGSFVCIIVSKDIQKSTEIKLNTEKESDIEIEN